MCCMTTTTPGNKLKEQKHVVGKVTAWHWPIWNKRVNFRH